MQLTLNMENQYIQQYSHLLDVEIPNQRDRLKATVNDLEQVAQFREDVYIQSNDANKTGILNQTKRDTIQALASVASQIYALGNMFNDVLKSQSDLIDSVSLKVNQIGQDICIHKEKVARREIGGLTTSKTIVHNVKIKRPDFDEKQVKYIRKPIDYSLLDDIGKLVFIKAEGTESDQFQSLRLLF
jgi:abl interactor 2